MNNFTRGWGWRRQSARQDSCFLHTLVRQVRFNCAFSSAWILERPGRSKTQNEEDFLHVHVRTHSQKPRAQNLRMCAHVG